MNKNETKTNDVENTFIHNGNYIINKVQTKTPEKSRTVIFQYMYLFMELYVKDIDIIINKLHDYVIKVDTNMIDIIYLYLDINKESLNYYTNIELSIAKDIYDNIALLDVDEDEEMKYVENLESNISQPLQVYVELLN